MSLRREELRSCKRKYIAVGRREDMLIPAPSIPTRAGGRCLSTGKSMAPDTLGREAVPPAPTPIREGRTPRGKCFASSSNTGTARPPFECAFRRKSGRRQAHHHGIWGHDGAAVGPRDWQSLVGTFETKRSCSRGTRMTEFDPTGQRLIRSWCQRARGRLRGARIIGQWSHGSR
jgi:hypothetical protein